MTRQTHRLPTPAYADLGALCSITIAVKDRRPVFADGAVARAATDTLLRHSENTGVRVVAWCIMPDHIHLILSPSISCDLITFVGQFKNLAQRAAWRIGVVGAFWQPSFWDRFLRTEDDLPSVVRYVLENPVRARLVTAYQDHPHSGIGAGVVVGERGQRLSARSAA